MKGRGTKFLIVHPSPSQRLYEPAATLTLPRWHWHLARGDRLEAYSTKGGGDILGKFRIFLVTIYFPFLFQNL